MNSINRESGGVFAADGCIQSGRKAVKRGGNGQGIYSRPEVAAIEVNTCKFCSNSRILGSHMEVVLEASHKSVKREVLQTRLNQTIH